jgi:hypothetical protein
MKIVSTVANSMGEQVSLDREHYRALALLAENPDGYTRAMMIAHGFSLAITSSLVRAGLATTKRLGTGKRTIARVRITDAGRRLLDGCDPHDPSGSTEP